MRSFVAAILTTALAVIAVPASAQEASRTRPSFEGVEIVTGLMDFDLSGTGQTMTFDVRGSKALTGRLALEFGTTVARPSQQFGDSNLIIPEAQLTYAWRIGRVRPFVRGGGGLAYETRTGLESRWRPALSGGGGARIDLTDRLHVVGEMRLRGIGSQFEATTAEWLGGVGWTLR